MFIARWHWEMPTIFGSKLLFGKISLLCEITRISFTGEIHMCTSTSTQTHTHTLIFLYCSCKRSPYFSVWVTNFRTVATWRSTHVLWQRQTIWDGWVLKQYFTVNNRTCIHCVKDGIQECGSNLLEQIPCHRYAWMCVCVWHVQARHHLLLEFARFLIPK